MAEDHQASSAPLAPLLVLTGGIAAVGSNSLVLSPILTDVATALAASPAEVARASAAYGGATALAALLLAPRIDRVGTRRSLRAGLACLTVAALLSAAAGHWAMLMLAQAVAGLGAGVVLPASYALATIVARPGHEARSLGRVLTGWSISLVAGVPGSALLSDALGWHAPFLALAALAGLAVLGVGWLPRDQARRPTGEVPDYPPLAPLREATVPKLLFICLAYMAAFYGVYAFLGDHLRALHAISAGRAGLFVLAYGLGFGLASLADGLVDRWGAARAFPSALLLVAAVYALMAPAARLEAAIIPLAALWGFANHVALNILLLLLSRVRPDRRGAVLGLNSAVTYLGALIGVGAAGIAYEAIGFAPLAGGAAGALALAAGLAMTLTAPRRPPASATGLRRDAT